MNSFQAIKCLIWLCLLLPETICLVSFPLDAPPAFAAAWYSLAELQSLSKHLGINGVLTNENLFRSSLDQGLYESIQRDWKKNWMRFRKWMAQGSGGFTEEKTNQTESSILLENDKWSRIKASNLTIGLQVSLDASLQLRPRLLLEIDGCTRLGAASEFESLKKSKLLSSVTQYSSRDGIQSCDQVCPEAAVEMIAHWKKESLVRKRAPPFESRFLTHTKYRIAKYTVRTLNIYTTAAVSMFSGISDSNGHIFTPVPGPGLQTA